MIISMSSLGTHGRLGNQLFQITSLLGLAEKYNAQAVFLPWGYEQYFETSIPHGAMSNNTIQEKYFHYYDWELSGDSDLVGYLQSEKYFGSQRLKLKKGFVDSIKTKYSIFNKETICIQIRRGDYVGNPNYYQIPITFYIDALLTHFPNWRESNIVVISDDIEYCKVHFDCLPNVTFGGESDIEDMALASCCDHFIVSNSSFGWWCAYLGEKPTSKIIHCGRLHAGGLSNKGNEDYYPERWIKFQKDDYKLDLRDVTFTIPLLFDHPSRKENFEVILCMLQIAFSSNYIICEQGGSHFAYAGKWARYMSIDSKVFHRTKMLNDMALTATTPYIANWDCDVIVPPLQVYLAVESLRNGVDMVYPYNGGFARMSRHPWFQQIQKSLDIGIVKDTPFKGRDPAENSVGGCVLWNKESFIDAGMENENMVSFGPEDVERYNRARKLGYSTEHIKGFLFHINHNVGNDSSPRNPYFPHNVDEQQKIDRLSRTELRAYVDTWAWRHSYTSQYYHRISEGAILSAKIVMEELDRIGVPTKDVIDVGCGVGEWSNENPNYIGIDYKVRKDQLMIELGSFIECDLNREFPPLPHKKFDLAICLEVAEHLKPSRAKPLVEYLCQISDNVLFSAAIPDQGGNGHVNEQWQEYWAELFYKQGFGVYRKEFLEFIRQNREIELWYRQNTVLYQHGSQKRDVENFVLPEYYEQIVLGLKNRK